MIENMLLDYNLLEFTQALILEHFTNRTNSLNKNHYSNAPDLTPEELDLLNDILLFTGTISTNSSAALGYSNDCLPE